MSAAADENPSPGDYLRIAVRDTGEGMTDEVRTRAFEAFFTTKDTSGGSGLGLSQAYAFATRTGGYAELESAVGEGTTVILFLPLTPEAVTSATSLAGTAEADDRQPSKSLHLPKHSA